MTKSPMTDTLNEQMREKAKQVWGEMERSRGSFYQTDKPAYIEAYAEALLEAHAAGRQEILDRLPSDIEFHKWWERESTFGHTQVAPASVFYWLRKRLMGEGDG